MDDTLARRLTRTRRSCHLTQTEVCQATGLSVPHLSRLENGHDDNPTLKTLLDLCKVYSCELTDLVPPNYVIVAAPGSKKEPASGGMTWADFCDGPGWY